tara:strand:+ start:607 stop:1272 length:666 start_codon:yes stop_codon:yes gene_type:complete
MRKLILDTETSGLDPENDRIIELACLELIDDLPTEKRFHKYYNPGDILISNEAEKIHGLNNNFLRKFPTFDESIDEFIEFLDDSKIIAHNAQFDISMINASFKRKGREKISDEKSICTLEMAKKKFPGSKNNLNALCRRFNISLVDREKHGALTDCYLLLRVYTELTGGKQGSLTLTERGAKKQVDFKLPKKIEPIFVEVSEEEEKSHNLMLKKITKSLWF